MDILNKGDTSYDFVSQTTSASAKPTVELSTLLENIVSSVSKFSEMVARAPKNKELCAYIIKPLGLFADVAYHITNTFTNDSTRTFDVEQLITDGPQALNDLYKKLKYALAKGNELKAINTAHSNTNVIMLMSNLSNNLGSLSNVMDYGKVGKITTIASNGLKNYEDFIRHDEVMQLQTDKITDLAGGVSNYNQFKIKYPYTSKYENKPLVDNNDSCIISGTILTTIDDNDNNSKLASLYYTLKLLIFYLFKFRS
jgi:hypothetical protein